MKIAAAALVGCLTAASVQAQPALSSAWLDTDLSEQLCLERAELAMHQLGWKRIERLSNFASVLGDSRDGQYQILIRCAERKNAVFIAAAGPQEPEATKLAEMAKQQFNRLSGR